MKRTQQAYRERLRQQWVNIDKRRRMAMLFHEQGKSLREIATELGVSYVTVRKDIQHMKLVEAGVSL